MKGKWLRVSIVLLLTGWLLGCDSSLTEAEYLDRASKGIQKGDVAAAVIDLKNALKVNAASPEAHELLGNLMLKSSSPALAEVEFEKLKQFGVNESVWLAGLTKSYLLQGKLDQVLAVDGAKSDLKGQVNILAYQAMVLVLRKKNLDAKVLLDKASELGGETVDLQLAKTRLYSSSGDFQDARIVIDEVLNNDPHQFDALMLLGDMELHQNNLQKAQSAYAGAQKSAPERIRSSIQLAKVTLAMGEEKAGQQLLDGLLKRYPNHPAVNLLQATLFIKQNKRNKALPFAEKASRATNAPLDVFYLAGMIHLENNRLEQAGQYANQLYAKAPDAIASNLLRAKVWLKQDKLDEAVSLSSRVLAAQAKNVEALNIKAAALMQQGKVTEAVGYYKQALVLKPEDIKFQMRLVEALLLSKQYAEVSPIVDKGLVANPDNIQLLALKARNFIGQQEFDKATSLIVKLKNEMTGKALPFLLENQLFIAQGLEGSAKTSLMKACETEPKGPYACLAYAERLVTDKEYDKGLTVYEQLITANKLNLNAAMGKVKVLALLQSPDELKNWLQQVVAGFPNALSPKLGLAQLYLSEGEADRALSVLSSTDKATVSNTAYMQMLASAQVAAGQLKQADVIVSNLLKREPDNRQAQLLDVVVQSYLGHPKAAEPRLRSMLVTTPDNQVLNIALARVLNQQGKHDDASAVLAKLSPKTSERVDVLQLKSVLAMAKGDFATATKLAQNVFDKQPSTINLLVLAQQMWRNGDKNKTITLMTDWLKKLPHDSRTRIELGNLYMRSLDNDKAITEFETIIEVENDNIAALNNLAFLLKDSNPKRAVDLASKVNDLKPGVPAFLDTLAMAHLENGDADLALRYIEQAIEKQKAPVFIYHKAMINAKKGDWLPAIKSLTELLKDKASFSERKEAEILLEKLKAGS